MLPCCALQVCDQYVERMGQEVEQLQVMALSHALEVAVGIVDVGGSEIGYLQHPSGAAAPLFWLVHLPGHYDIVSSTSAGPLLRSRQRVTHAAMQRLPPCNACRPCKDATAQATSSLTARTCCHVLARSTCRRAWTRACCCTLDPPGRTCEPLGCMLEAPGDV